MNFAHATCMMLTLVTMSACATSVPASTDSVDPDQNPDPDHRDFDSGAGTPDPPAISGFNIKLAPGPRWSFVYKSVWKGATTTCHESYVLSQPESRGGLEAYRVTVTSQCDSYPANQYAPSVEWVAIDGQRFMGSTDGVAFYPLFDAQVGKWPGNGGFFDRVSGGGVKGASKATYHSQSVYSIRWDTGNGCQTLPGYGQVCGSADPNRSAHMTEYWNLTDGPVGYVYNGCVTGGCVDDQVYPE